jgi:hypothetical protein
LLALFHYTQQYIKIIGLLVKILSKVVLKLANLVQLDVIPAHIVAIASDMLIAHYAIQDLIMLN